MSRQFALIGYGEAGSTFARAAGWQADVRVYDLLPLEPVYAADGVLGCGTSDLAIGGAPAVISLVTADQALNAAHDAAQHIAKGALYLDMNSVAPGTKSAAASAIEAAGGHYIDVAIMAPVNPARLDVALLVSGPCAAQGIALLHDLGFTNVRMVGDAVGRASTIKMLRSVFYKGLEALTAECLVACARAGVTEDVIGSFGGDWSEQANYRLDRMMVHGTRRAAEMGEAVTTLEALGVHAALTRGTVERQAQIGALGFKEPPTTLGEKLERLMSA